MVCGKKLGDQGGERSYLSIGEETEARSGKKALMLIKHPQEKPERQLNISIKGKSPFYGGGSKKYEVKKLRCHLKISSALY